MRRIQSSDAIPDLHGPGKPGFGPDGTTLDDEHANGVQEEIVGIIEDAGLTPSTARQLKAALDILYGQTRVMPYQLGRGIYSGARLDLSAQLDFNVGGIAFSRGGLELYAAGETLLGETVIHQWTLGKAHDLASASYASRSLTIPGVNPVLSGMYVKDDGTKLYLLLQGDSRIYQWTLLTPHQIDSGTDDGVFLQYTAQDPNAGGFTISEDGTKIFLVTTTADVAYRYSMPAWDLANANYDSQNVSLSADVGFPSGVGVSPDGTQMLILDGSGPDGVVRYELTTPFDLTSASARESLDISSVQPGASDLRLSPNGYRMFVCGSQPFAVDEFFINSVVSTVT